MTSQLTHNCSFVLCIFSKTIHRKNAIESFFERYHCGAFDKKASTTIKAELTTQQQILLLSILSLLSMLLFFLNASNSFCDVIMLSGTNKVKIRSKKAVGSRLKLLFTVL